MERMIEATELERFCVQQFFTGAIQPKDRVEQRRYDRLFGALKLDDVADKLDRMSKEDRNKPLTDNFAAELVAFPVSEDVLEYFLKATDTQIPGGWVRHILRVAERMIAAKDKPIEKPAPVVAIMD